MKVENMLTICEKHEPRATVLYRGEGCPLCEFDPAPEEESLGVVEAFGVLRSLMSSDRYGADGALRAKSLAERNDPVGLCPHCLVSLVMRGEKTCERCSL